MAFNIESFGFSDIGLVRPNNEDVWGMLQDNPFYVLADGMGGHKAGEVASKEAVDAMLGIMQKHFEQTPLQQNTIQELKLIIAEGIELVNAIIYSIGRSDEKLKGMGTTLVALCVHPSGVVIGHVGDSRIYRFRKGILELLTKDNTLACQLMDQGFLVESDASYCSYKNIITKAIGNGSELLPAVNFVEAESEDLYLLCSDGLTDMLTNDDITSILMENEPVEILAKRLINSAKENGGFDNITTVLIRLTDDAHLPR